MRRRRLQTLKPIRIVLLGKDGVGKSALTVRFLTRRFIGEYDKTLESTYRHQVLVDNESIPVDIFDTAGENTDEKLRQCIRQSDLFVVLYSIDDRLSFKEAKRIVKFLRDNKNVDPTSLAIVGTKKDLEHFRDVQFEEGSELSGQVEGSFYEVSNAEDYMEAQDVFGAFLRNFLRRREKKDTSLKVPSIIKRTPSFERKKKSGRHFQEQAKPNASSEKNSEEKNEEQDGCNAEDRLNNNTPNGHCKHEESSSNEARIRRTQQNGGPSTPRVKSPFDVEKIKSSASREKRQLVPAAQRLSPEELPKLPSIIKVQKVKESSANEWMRPLPAELIKAPLMIDREKDRHSKTNKGPFRMDKSRSQSASSIRSAAANEKPRSSSSLSRVREGFNLIGKTRSQLRRKPIVL